MQIPIKATCPNCKSFIEFSQGQWCPSCGASIQSLIKQLESRKQDLGFESDFGVRVCSKGTDQKAIAHRG